MQISRKFSWEVAPNAGGWSKTAIFSAFGLYIFGTFRDKVKIIYMVIYSPALAFQWPKIDDLEWTFYVESCFFAAVCLHVELWNVAFGNNCANSSPGNVFATFSVNNNRGGGLKWPQAYLEFEIHSDKIPTATHLFSGSGFLKVVLPISWDVDVC